MFERCLYFNTNALSRKLSARWDEAYSKFDLAAPHAYLLKFVLKYPGLNQQELAEKLQVNKSTITRFITTVEQKGLIERGKSKDGVKGRVVMPTDQALAIQKDLDKTRNELYAEISELVGDEKMETFIQVSRLMNTKLAEL